MELDLEMLAGIAFSTVYGLFDFLDDTEEADKMSVEEMKSSNYDMQL